MKHPSPLSLVIFILAYKSHILTKMDASRWVGVGLHYAVQHKPSSFVCVHSTDDAVYAQNLMLLGSAL